MALYKLRLLLTDDCCNGGAFRAKYYRKFTGNVITVKIVSNRKEREEMPFTFTKTELEGVIIVEPRVFADERGFFMESYKTSEYSPPHDGGIRWNDTDIGVEWGIESPLVSEKDVKMPFLKDLLG